MIEPLTELFEQAQAVLHGSRQHRARTAGCLVVGCTAALATPAAHYGPVAALTAAVVVYPAALVVAARLTKARKLALLLASCWAVFTLLRGTVALVTGKGTSR